MKKMTVMNGSTKKDKNLISVIKNTSTVWGSTQIETINAKIHTTAQMSFFRYSMIYLQIRKYE